MNVVRDRTVKGSEGRFMPVDLFAPEASGNEKLPVVIFAHGFKGFKDFGAWNLVAPRFAKNNFIFLKFNFSHNGGTVEQPIDFPDLEAFARNSYSKELYDLGCILDAVSDGSLLQDLPADPRQVFLIGHSRGGGIAILKAAADARIKKLATWAAVSDLHQRIPSSDIEKWKEEGVVHIPNARTGQQMPIYYGFYEDLMENAARLRIPYAARTIDVPWVIVHGTKDPTVPLQEARDLAAYCPRAETFFVEGADHTFDQKQPWEKETMPEALEQVVDRTLQHFQKGT